MDEQPPAAEPAPAPEPAPAHPLVAPIEAWFARHFANSVFSRDPALGNAFGAARDDLVETLTKEFPHV